MTTIRLIAALAALLAASCNSPTVRGGVRPAPPGPLDIVRGTIWGDFSGLCPKHYDFCRGGRLSICCPAGGCCEDQNGPYCCASGAYRGPHDYAYDREEDAPDLAQCRSRDITCSQGGRTICCDGDQSCCADQTGPFCCAPWSQSDRRTHEERYDDGY